MTTGLERMFDSIARSNPQFADYLTTELTKQVNVLELATDSVAIHRAQGHASCLRKLLLLLSSPRPQ